MRNRALRKRTNEEWYRELNLPSPECDNAIEDLRLYLILGLKAALSHTKNLNREALEDFAQEALTKVLSELDSFRGECRLISWATKIAINHALSALRPLPRAPGGDSPSCACFPTRRAQGIRHGRAPSTTQRRCGRWRE